MKTIRVSGAPLLDIRCHLGEGPLLQSLRARNAASFAPPKTQADLTCPRTQPVPARYARAALPRHCARRGPPLQLRVESARGRRVRRARVVHPAPSGPARLHRRRRPRLRLFAFSSTWVVARLARRRALPRRARARPAPAHQDVQRRRDRHARALHGGHQAGQGRAHGQEGGGHVAARRRGQARQGHGRPGATQRHQLLRRQDQNVLCRHDRAHHLGVRLRRLDRRLQQPPHVPPLALAYRARRPPRRPPRRRRRQRLLGALRRRQDHPVQADGRTRPRDRVRRRAARHGVRARRQGRQHAVRHDGELGREWRRPGRGARAAVRREERRRVGGRPERRGGQGEGAVLLPRSGLEGAAVTKSSR